MISNLLKNKIVNSSSLERESCGFIVERKSGLDLINLKNFSKDKDQFEICPIDFLNIKNNFNIKYIYHSHLRDENKNFSYLDKETSRLLCLDGLLYIIPMDRFKIYSYKEDKESWLE